MKNKNQFKGTFNEYFFKKQKGRKSSRKKGGEGNRKPEQEVILFEYCGAWSAAVGEAHHVIHLCSLQMDVGKAMSSSFTQSHSHTPMHKHTHKDNQNTCVFFASTVLLYKRIIPYSSTDCILPWSHALPSPRTPEQTIMDPASRYFWDRCFQTSFCFYSIQNSWLQLVSFQTQLLSQSQPL